MDAATARKILDIQDAMRNDGEYQGLLKEHDILNARFLQTIDTLTPEQRANILDYIGLLIEVHLRTLEHAVSEEG